MVDRTAARRAGTQERLRLGERDHVHGDRLALVAAAVRHAGEAGGAQQRDGLVGEARRDGAFQDHGPVGRLKAGLFEQLTLRGVEDGFGLAAVVIADQARGQLDHRSADRGAALLDQDDRVGRGGDDGHHRVAADAGDVLPAGVVQQGEEAAAVQRPHVAQGDHTMRLCGPTSGMSNISDTIFQPCEA